MMRRMALLFLCALFLGGCGQARRVYQVGLLAMEVPKAMMVSKDSHDDKALAAESVTVNLILNRAEPDDPEGYLLASMTDIDATEEKYADKLQGKTVNEYFLAQDDVTQRVVDGLAEGKITDVHIQDTTPRDMGNGIRALQVSFTGKDQRGRLREYRVIMFYDQGREYRVVAYWDADAPKDQKDMMQAMLDSIRLQK